MAMEACARCGVVDPHLMFGLMSRWFALPAGLELEGGYFYLCPRCFDATIAPDLEDILDRLREHHPAPGPAPSPEHRAESAEKSPPRESAEPDTTG
jgi:hypothetical protein